MKYLRRFVWYLASRLMLICAILGLMTVAFYYTMNATNIYIVLKDGMAKRAQVIMHVEEDIDLDKFFLQSYLERDELIIATRQNNSPYDNFTIVGIDHRLDMQWMWSWPWEDTARADIIERIPKIDGRVKSSAREGLLEASGGDESVLTPTWQGAKYKATLTRENGQWRIRSLTFDGYVN